MPGTTSSKKRSWKLFFVLFRNVHRMNSFGIIGIKEHWLNKGLNMSLNKSYKIWKFSRRLAKLWQLHHNSFCNEQLILKTISFILVKNISFCLSVFQKRCRDIFCAIMRTIASMRQWVLYNLKYTFWYLNELGNTASIDHWKYY